MNKREADRERRVLTAQRLVWENPTITLPQMHNELRQITGASLAPEKLDVLICNNRDLRKAVHALCEGWQSMFAQLNYIQVGVSNLESKNGAIGEAIFNEDGVLKFYPGKPEFTEDDDLEQDGRL